MSLTASEQKELEKLELEKLLAEKAAATRGGGKLRTYVVSTDRGDYEIEANRTPTAEEAAQAIGAMRVPSRAYSDKQIRDYAMKLEAAGAPPDEIEEFVRSAKGGAAAPAAPKREPAYTAMTDMGLGGLTHDEVVAGSKIAGATAVRAAPIAAAVAFPPAGIAGWLGLGAVGGGSEAAARFIEGDEVLSRKGASEVGKATVLNATPLPKVKGAVSAGKALLQGGKTAAALVGTEAAAETARRSIEDERLSTYDSIASGLKQNLLPVAFGLVSGGGASRLMGIAEKKASHEARRGFLAEIGAQQPTLAMLDPDVAQWEQRVAAHSPEVAQKIGNARSGITREFYAQLGDAPLNSEIHAKISPLMKVADETESVYKAAETAHGQALQKLQAAETAVGVSESERRVLRESALAELATSTNQRAAALFRQNAALGATVTNTEKAEELGKVMRDVMQTRSQRSRSLYRDAGIDEGAAIFPKKELIDAAVAKLGPQADTTTGRSLISAIGSATKGNAPLTLAQLRDTRNHLAAAFAGRARGTLNNAERLAAEVHDELLKRARNTIAVEFGSDALGKWDTAQKFWRETSQIQDSQLGRALLQRTETPDSVLESIAANMARGNVDELTKFKEFVGAIGQYDKPVAELAVQTMAGALKNAFVLKNTHGGTLKVDALLSDLTNAASSGKLPLPVESLGFGSLETLAHWRAALREFKPGEITPAVFESVLSNPGVQQVLATGGADGRAILRDATATEVFGRMLETEVALRHAGKTEAARRVANEARIFAAEKKVAASDAQRALARVEANPVLSAFSGKSDFKLTHEAGKTGAGTVTQLLSEMPPATAGKLMRGLRDNDAQLADMVERRLLANELGRFAVTDARNPGNTSLLDVPNLRRYFAPGSERLAFLENTVRPEAMGKVKSFVTKLAAIDDDMRRGQFPADSQLESLIASVGAASSVAPRIGPAQRITIFNRLRDLIDHKAYNVLAATFTNRDVANAIFDTSASLADALSSVGTQKAFLLLKDVQLSSEMGSLHDRPNWRGKKATTPAQPQ